MRTAGYFLAVHFIKSHQVIELKRGFLAFMIWLIVYNHYSKASAS